MSKKHFTLRKQAERELLYNKIHDKTPWFRIQKIDMCTNFYMLSYGEYTNLTKCQNLWVYMV